MTMTKPTSEQVTFLAAGSGASQRTVLDKLRDVVSVKDFGAVGDGVADDTAAIQAALASGAREVVIPAGTYRATGLTISAPITVTGTGVLVKPTASSTPLITVSASNVVIDGLELRGASLNAKPATRVAGDTAILCAGTSSVAPRSFVTFRNLIINGFSDFGLFVRYANDATVSGTNVSFCGYAGIMFLSVLRGTINANIVQEIDSSAGAVTWYGISLTRDPSQNSTNSAPCTQCIVSNNVVRNVAQWTGIDSHALHQSLITGNTVSGCKNGIYAQYDDALAAFPMEARQVEISNNIVVGRTTPSESVIGIASLGLSSLPNDAIVIIGNMISGCGDWGSALGALHVNNTTNSKASENHVVRAVRVGISIDGTCSYVNINGNVVDGVQAGSSSASYAYLTLTNLSNCTLENNRFRNTTGSGTFTPTQGILYDGTVPATGIVLSRNRMDGITNKLQRVGGSANVYTDLAWQLETESCPAFTHVCTGGALIEATANQSSNFRRVPNTTGTFITRTRAVFEATAGPPASYRLGVRGNYTSVFTVGVYALDGVTNIAASTSVANIVLSIDGVYWVD